MIKISIFLFTFYLFPVIIIINLVITSERILPTMKYFFYSIIAICITAVILTIIGSLTPEMLTAVLKDFCKVLGTLVVGVIAFKLCHFFF